MPRSVPNSMFRPQSNRTPPAATSARVALATSDSATKDNDCSKLLCGMKLPAAAATISRPHQRIGAISNAAVSTA